MGPEECGDRRNQLLQMRKGGFSERHHLNERNDELFDMQMVKAMMLREPMSKDGKTQCNHEYLGKPQEPAPKMEVKGEVLVN